MRNLLGCILTPLLALQVSCSGQGFSSDPERQNQDPPVTNEREDSAKKKTDTNATEPSIIVGAYLACNKIDETSSESSSYGCSMMTKDHNKLIAPAGYTIVFRAESGASSLPALDQAPSSAYHVVFNISAPLTADLVVGAAIIPDNGLKPGSQGGVLRPEDLPYHVRIPLEKTQITATNDPPAQEKPMGSSQGTGSKNCNCKRKMSTF